MDSCCLLSLPIILSKWANTRCKTRPVAPEVLPVLGSYPGKKSWSLSRGSWKTSWSGSSWSYITNTFPCIEIIDVKAGQSQANPYACSVHLVKCYGRIKTAVCKHLATQHDQLHHPTTEVMHENDKTETKLCLQLPVLYQDEWSSAKCPCRWWIFLLPGVNFSIYKHV